MYFFIIFICLLNLILIRSGGVQKILQFYEIHRYKSYIFSEIIFYIAVYQDTKYKECNRNY
jgi:hypothetical protein